MSNTKSKILFLFVIGGMILLGITMSSLPKKNTFVSQAGGSCNCDAETCYPDCSRNKARTDCPGGSGPDPQYMSDNYCVKPPQCCNDLATDGAAGCCWPERKYCLPSQCDKIDGSRERCGAAYDPSEPWPLGCYGYAGQNKPTNTPGPAKPTNSPTPTRKPTKVPKPTKTPTPQINPTTEPTLPFQPTNPAPTLQSTQQPQISTEPLFQTNQTSVNQTQEPQPSTFSIMAFFGPVRQIEQKVQLPSLNGEIPIQKPIRFVDAQAPKAFNMFTWIYNRVTFYDRMLELKMNTTIHNAVTPLFQP